MSECELFWEGGMFCWVGGGEWGCMGYYFWQVEKYWVGECVSGVCVGGGGGGGWGWSGGGCTV